MDTKDKLAEDFFFADSRRDFSLTSSQTDKKKGQSNTRESVLDTDDTDVLFCANIFLRFRFFFKAYTTLMFVLFCFLFTKLIFLS